MLVKQVRNYKFVTYNPLKIGSALSAFNIAKTSHTY